MNYHLLDSWAILAFLWKEEPAASDVRQLLHLAQTDNEQRLLVSMINLGEVYYRVYREQSSSVALKTVETLHQLPLTFLSATDKRVMAAAKLKGQYTISYADAFAAAATLEFDATLWTGDPELIALGSLLKVNALQRQK